MTTHQVSSNGFDWRQNAVKAEELRLQRHDYRHDHRQGHMRTDGGKEGRREGSELDGVKGLETRPRDIGHVGHRWRFDDDRRGDYSRGGHRDGRYDRSDFSGRGQNVHWRPERDSRLQQMPGMYGNMQSINFSYSYTRVEIYHSQVFSGNWDNREDAMKARDDFANAALDFIKNPSEASYKALNDSMMKLMDSGFAPANVNGNAQISIFSTSSSVYARFTMEVTPAPTKSLEEAREDLHNNYNEETYKNYIRALSEKFKKDGVISHTNDTPTTPVFKSSVVYSSKTSKGGMKGFHELRRPDFDRNFHGRHRIKNKGFDWDKSVRSLNDYWGTRNGRDQFKAADYIRRLKTDRRAG